MFNVPAYTSKRPTDCAATCLKMLLSYYGEENELIDLIKEIKTGIAGASARQVFLAMRNHGLEPHAYKIDAEEVIHQDRPSICWWEYNHFVICCGLNENGDVVICNPDRGRFPIDVGTFKCKFSDFAIFNGEPPIMPEYCHEEDKEQ